MVATEIDHEGEPGSPHLDESIGVMKSTVCLLTSYSSSHSALASLAIPQMKDMRAVTDTIFA
jgi:hypothetical protein